MPRIAKLVVIKGPNKDMSCVIAEHSEVTLGRNLQCSIPLPDPKLSRIHCVVRHVEDYYEVLDNNSKNGILIGKKKIDQSKILQPGEIIEIGDCLIKFVLEETTD